MATTCSKNSNWFESVEIVVRTKPWSVRLDFDGEMASSHAGTFSRALLQVLVTGTSSLVCTDFFMLGRSFTKNNDFSTLPIYFFCWILTKICYAESGVGPRIIFVTATQRN